MPTRNFKFFRDPIHGYIEVDANFLPLIDSALFQRLRRIKQLAFTDLVYHGAEHSRFGHSLGTLYLAEEITEKLKIKDRERKDEFHLAALLHDIGHPPYSHAFEPIIEKMYENKDHEDYTDAIIRYSEIGDLIEKLGISKDAVAKLIKGKYVKYPNFSYLNDLISSELDVDRLDFLLRDSYYCGVPYGKYDIQRLLLSLKKKGKNIVVEEKARHAAESFILSRFWMYTQVYTHHTRRAFDLMLKSMFTDDVIEELDYPGPKQKEIDNIVYYDDAWLLRTINEIAKSRHKDEAFLAKLLLKREHIRPVLWKIAYAERESQRIDPEFAAIETLESFKDEIASKMKISPNLIFFDRPWKDLPFESKYRQYGSSKEGSAIQLLLRGGKTSDIADDPSSLAYNVSRWIARIVRVYTLKEKRKTLKEIIARKCSNLTGLLATE